MAGEQGRASKHTCVRTLPVVPKRAREEARPSHLVQQEAEQRAQRGVDVAARVVVRKGAHRHQVAGLQQARQRAVVHQQRAVQRTAQARKVLDPAPQRRLAGVLRVQPARGGGGGARGGSRRPWVPPLARKRTPWQQWGAALPLATWQGARTCPVVCARRGGRGREESAHRWAKKARCGSMRCSTLSAWRCPAAVKSTTSKCCAAVARNWRRKGRVQQRARVPWSSMYLRTQWGQQIGGQRGWMHFLR